MSECSWLPTPAWDTETGTLRDVAAKDACPTILRVVKGHYMNIGVQKLPLTRMYQDVFLHSVSKMVKVFCHSVRVRNESKSRRFPYTLVPLDQRLAIPLTYEGWFELLSEDGKAAKPMETVQSLARRFPEKCIVRENINAYATDPDGEVDFGKQVNVPTGEILTLVDSAVKTQEIKGPAKTNCLRVLDSKGRTLFFTYDQRGLFTPVAGRDSISGVHTIRDIVSKFRLPLTVKLTQGVWPKADQSRFTGVIRLDWVYSDNTAFMCPLIKDNLRMLPVPIDTQLKVCMIKNMTEVRESDTYNVIMQKCNRMLVNYNNTIHLVTSVPDSTVLTRQNSNSIQQSLSNEKRGFPDSNQNLLNAKEERLLDEIDDIYQYVRGGGTPPETNFTFESDDEHDNGENVYENLSDVAEKVDGIECGRSAANMTEGKVTDVSCQYETVSKQTAVEQLLKIEQSTTDSAKVSSAGMAASAGVSSEPSIHKAALTGNKVEGVSEIGTENDGGDRSEKSTSAPNALDHNSDLPPKGCCEPSNIRNAKYTNKNNFVLDENAASTTETCSNGVDIRSQLATDDKSSNRGHHKSQTLGSSFKENERIPEYVSTINVSNNLAATSVISPRKISCPAFTPHRALQNTESVPGHKNEATSESVSSPIYNHKILKKQVSTPAVTSKQRRKSAGVTSLQDIFRWKRAKSASPPVLLPTPNNSVVDDRFITILGVPTSSSTTEPSSNKNEQLNKKSNHNYSKNSNGKAAGEDIQQKKFLLYRSKSRDMDSIHGTSGSVRLLGNGVISSRVLQPGMRDKVAKGRNSIGQSSDIRRKIQTMYL